MKDKISEALSQVKRESRHEKLEEKYISDESDLSKISIKHVKTEIEKELGLHVGPTDVEQRKGTKENFLKILNQYKGHSYSREWSSEDRKYFQTLTWMDFGKKIPHLQKLELPEERFTYHKEADDYAETFGGYCDGLQYRAKDRMGYSNQFRVDPRARNGAPRHC